MTPESLINELAERLGVEAKEILSSDRSAHLVAARALAVHKMRDEMGMTFSTIGKYLGGRDHGTVMYAYKKDRVEEEFDKHVILRRGGATVERPTIKAQDLDKKFISDRHKANRVTRALKCLRAYQLRCDGYEREDIAERFCVDREAATRMFAMGEKLMEHFTEARA